jgi:hypothetical protein
MKNMNQRHDYGSKNERDLGLYCQVTVESYLTHAMPTITMNDIYHIVLLFVRAGRSLQDHE